jgi:hypothetical protein
MQKDLDVTVQRYFTLIINALKKEDKILKKAFSKFRYDPSDDTGQGITDLYEHHIQYVLFREFVEKGPLFVYMEDPYKKKRWKCDLTLYYPNVEKSIWIEIKVTGWCYDREYTKWIQRDIDKLSNIPDRGIMKYLLVTSVEEEKPIIKEWATWFKKMKDSPHFSFNPRLFSYFKTQFSDGKTFRPGYYAVCLLQII